MWWVQGRKNIASICWKGQERRLKKWQGTGEMHGESASSTEGLRWAWLEGWGGLLRPGWGVWAFILRAGLRIVVFTFLHNLAQWRWNWREQDGRPRDQEGGYMEIRVRDGGAFMEKGFGHFEPGAGYFYLYSAHIWALNHGEYRKSSDLCWD